MKKEKQYKHYERIPMQFLCIKAHRDEKKELPEWLFGNDEINDIAYVSCWIQNQTEKNARFIAHGSIDDMGFNAEEIEDQYPIDRESYKDGDSHLQYYEQALMDDEVFVFNTCPPEQ